ncbi:hypothetical protein [Faecalibacterium prausnitzii]|uniref:hypothetical protein n=1 Tax=Faecalibacterium prausnitzii TaxID=853 RepID=UPI00130D6BED|nr:hypothetical protein [Faecalibacterium prausnitzii]
MNNMYGKDKFHDRQKAVLQKSAQKIENDSGWAQNNFMREYAEEILPASGAELSFGELCAIGEHVEQEAAFSATCRNMAWTWELVAKSRQSVSGSWT